VLLFQGKDYIEIDKKLGLFNYYFARTNLLIYESKGVQKDDRMEPLV